MHQSILLRGRVGPKRGVGVCRCSTITREPRLQRCRLQRQQATTNQPSTQPQQATIACTRFECCIGFRGSHVRNKSWYFHASPHLTSLHPSPAHLTRTSLVHFDIPPLLPQLSFADHGFTIPRDSFVCQALGRGSYPTPGPSVATSLFTNVALRAFKVSAKCAGGGNWNNEGYWKCNGLSSFN